MLKVVATCPEVEEVQGPQTLDAIAQEGAQRNLLGQGFVTFVPRMGVGKELDS